MAREVNESAGKAKVETLDEDLGRQLSFQASGNLCPMAGVIGGIAAQEGMKAVTGIYSPIKQWFYFDALECLASKDWSDFGVENLTEEMCKPVRLKGLRI